MPRRPRAMDYIFGNRHLNTHITSLRRQNHTHQNMTKMVPCMITDLAVLSRRNGTEEVPLPPGLPQKTNAKHEAMRPKVQVVRATVE